MAPRRPDFSFLDDEGEVFVAVSEAGLSWWGDSHNPNWGGGYGIGHQRFDEYLAKGPMKPAPTQITEAINARVRELLAQGYVGVEAWQLAAARERLAAGAEVGGFDANGRTLLHAIGGKFTAALLDAGADANARNPLTGETPLHDAARCSSTEKIDRLLAAGAELEARDDQARTPLVRALEQLGRGDVALRVATVRQLLRAGADPTQTRADGRSVDDLLD